MKVVMLCLALVLLGDAADVDYANQAGWGGVCNADDGTQQSPVDILSPVEPDFKVEANDPDATSFVYLPETAETATMTNSDNDNMLEYQFSEDLIYITPMFANITATLKGLELHWGSNNYGSEHRIDNIQYAAEAHLVTTYVYDATPDSTRNLYIARLFSVGAENAEIQQMIDAQKASGADRDIASFNASALYPANISEIIWYSGSSTVPGCDERVAWFVISEPFTVSEAQLDELRALPLGDGSGGTKDYNWRSIQDIPGAGPDWFTLNTSPTLFICPLLLVAVVAKLVM